MQTSGYFLSLCISALMGLSGCTFQAEDAETGDSSENVGEAAQALTSALLTTNMTPMTSVTNGKKIVYAAGYFHAVYQYATANGSSIRHEMSADGVDWNGYHEVDTNNSTNPAIAVAADGTVGVVYLRNSSNGTGEVYFKRRNQWGTWDLHTQLTNNTSSEGAQTPSIVARGNTMHVAWVKDSDIRYVSFGTNIGGALTTAAETVINNDPNSAQAFMPALMVGPGPSNTTAIRVAWYQRHAPNQNGDRYGYYYVAEKVSNVWQTPVNLRQVAWPLAFDPVTLAADVNPVTGDAYMLTAVKENSTNITRLWRSNTLSTPMSYTGMTYTQTGAYLGDIVARNENCESKFRMTFTGTGTGYGDTYYRTGTWTSGSSPTWFHASTIVAGDTRAQGALLQSVPIPNTNQVRHFVGMYEQHNAYYDMRVAYDTLPTPPACDPGGGETE